MPKLISGIPLTEVDDSIPHRRHAMCCPVCGSGDSSIRSFGRFESVDPPGGGGLVIVFEGIVCDHVWQIYFEKFHDPYPFMRVYTLVLEKKQP